MKWCSGIVTCEKCGHQHISVWPETCERQECPLCGHMTQSPPTEDDMSDIKFESGYDMNFFPSEENPQSLKGDATDPNLDSLEKSLMTPQELAEIDKKVAEAIGEQEPKHDWECVGTGYYESAYVCKICGEQYFGDALELEESRLPPCARKYSTDWNDAMFAAEKAGLWKKGYVFGKESYTEDNPYYVASHAHTDPGYNPLATKSDSGPLCISKAILHLKGIQ